MKRISLIVFALVLFVSVNCFGLGNNSNVNGQDQNQGQAQAQAQLQSQNQGQNQSLLNKIDNQDINLNNILNKICNVNENTNVNKNTNVNLNNNENKNTNVNGNLNANKNDLDNQNNQNIVFEDKREFPQPLQIALPVGTTGHNESIKNKGRRFVSLKDQTRFNNVLTVETAKTMIASNSFWSDVNVTAKVKKGVYPATTEVRIYPNINQFLRLFPESKFVEIGIAIGTSKGDSNSAMLTAKSVIEGCELGAEYLVGFEEDAERRFKFRGIGGGGSVNDAFGYDTVAGATTGINFGSNRYEQFPYQKVYLLKKVK